ncbi:MAG: hypothetical protein J5472_08080, partial [Clostridia bacterium]|nr:hypothetical protein [Clostridia bacterium]
MKKRLQRHLSILCVAMMLTGILPADVISESAAEPETVVTESSVTMPEAPADPAAEGTLATDPVSAIDPESVEPAPDPTPAEPAQEDAGAETDQEVKSNVATPQKPTPTIPVDATLNVGDSVNGKIKEDGTSVMRLTVAKAEDLILSAKGMELWVEVLNEKTEERNRYTSKDGSLLVHWSAKKGTYLLTFGAMKQNASGSFTVRVLNEETLLALENAQEKQEEQPAEETASAAKVETNESAAGTETEPEAENKKETPADPQEAEPAHVTNPVSAASDGHPVSDEEPAAVTVVPEQSAEDEQPAEKTEPASDEASAAVTVVPGQPAEDEQPAEKMEPASDEEPAAVTVVPEQSAEDEQPAEKTEPAS